MSIYYDDHDDYGHFDHHLQNQHDAFGHGGHYEDHGLFHQYAPEGGYHEDHGYDHDYSHYGDVYGYHEEISNKTDVSKVLSNICCPQNWNPRCLLTTILVMAVICMVASVGSIAITVFSNMTASKVSTSVVNETGMDDKEMQLLNSVRQNLTMLVDEARTRQADITDQLKAKQLGITDLYTHLDGGNESTPASSCSRILQTSSTAASGYYWVRAGNGSRVRVYCDMTRTCGDVTGGWMEVARFNFGDHSSSCPSDFTMNVYEGVRSCRYRSNSAGCGTMTFDSLGIPYTRVCGKVIGYQKGSTNAFSRGSHTPAPDSNFVDGVILSHGTNPGTVIWVFAAALSDTLVSSTISLCPCNSPDANQAKSPPSFVGNNHYFCDSGFREPYQGSYQSLVVTNNPLWDGAGCNTKSSCCGLNNPPWFFREFTQEITDNLDMRVCRDEAYTNEDVNIAEVKMYIQ